MKQFNFSQINDLTEVLIVRFYITRHIFKTPPALLAGRQYIVTFICVIEMFGKN